MPNADTPPAIVNEPPATTSPFGNATTAATVPSIPAPSGDHVVPFPRDAVRRRATSRQERATDHDVAIRQCRQGLDGLTVATDAGAERRPRRAVPARDAVRRHAAGHREEPT